MARARREREEPKPKWTPLSSAIATNAVAILALIVAALAYYETRQARLTATRDEVVIRTHRVGGNASAVIRKISSGPIAMSGVSIPWDIVITNVGASTISISAIDIHELTSQGSHVLYVHLAGPVLTPDQQKAVDLPLSIEAGKSERLTVMVGLIAGSRAYKLLSAGLEGNAKPVSLNALEKTLAASKIDIYDNPAEPIFVSGEVRGWSVASPIREQSFAFSIKTVRGAVATDISSWYSSRRP